MVEIPEKVNLAIQWIAIIFIGLGPLFLWLGFADYKSILTQSALFGVLSYGTDVGTFVLVRFLMYSPGMVYAGMTLPIIGFVLILVLNLITIIPKGGLTPRDVLSLIGIILALVGAILAGITLMQWSDKALLGVISGLLRLTIIVLILLMQISDILWIIGAILMLTGFIILLVLVLKKEKA